jgi:hypothetical protein
MQYKFAAAAGTKCCPAKAKSQARACLNVGPCECIKNVWFYGHGWSGGGSQQIGEEWLNPIATKIIPQPI